MIRTLANNDPQPAQYLIDKIKQNVNVLRTEEMARREQSNDDNPRKMEISFTWVTGHMESVGNEAADELAKHAAEHGSSNRQFLPNLLHNKLPISLSAIKQQITSKTKTETKVWWKMSKCYKRIKCIDPSLPSRKFIKATSGLNCKQTSILTQLRTDHVPLNGHLFCNKTGRWPALFLTFP